MKKLLIFLFLISCNASNNPTTEKNGDSVDEKFSKYEELVNLFYDWREFEKPPLLNGAPNYTKKRFKEDQDNFLNLKNKLYNFDISNWSISDQIDWYIIKAEMSGYEFNYSILKPWERDPAFYQTIWMNQSDVPAHEGPTNHGVLEFWMYDLPLNGDSKKKFLHEMMSIPFQFVIIALKHRHNNQYLLYSYFHYRLQR